MKYEKIKSCGGEKPASGGNEPFKPKVSNLRLNIFAYFNCTHVL